MSIESDVGIKLRHTGSEAGIWVGSHSQVGDASGGFQFAGLQLQVPFGADAQSDDSLKFYASHRWSVDWVSVWRTGGVSQNRGVVQFPTGDQHTGSTQPRVRVRIICEGTAVNGEFTASFTEYPMMMWPYVWEPRRKNPHAWQVTALFPNSSGSEVVNVQMGGRFGPRGVPLERWDGDGVDVRAVVREG